MKVVDFGISKAKVEASKLKSMTACVMGTRGYIAPEVYSKAHLEGEGKGKPTWFEADVFSFAMTCAHVLSLEMPFEFTIPGQVYNELRNGERPGLPDYCPKEVVALLKDCWDIFQQWQASHKRNNSYSKPE